MAYFPLTDQVRVGYPEVSKAGDGNLALEGKNVVIQMPGRVVTSMVALTLTVSLVGCSAKPTATATPATKPATVAKLPSEADLVAVTLTPEAETRLGVATATIERRPITRAITMGGDVIVPFGRSSIVSAPQTGTLTVAEGGITPTPGLAVKKGQAVFTLLPILSAERALLNPAERVRFEADKAVAGGQLDTAKPRFETAKDTLERTEKLAKRGDVPNSALIDARNAYESAKATLDGAEKVWGIYSKGMADASEDAGKLAPLALRAPADGVLINVNVQNGQQVVAGSVLFEVANLDPVYIRVPIFVGEESTVALDKNATIGGLADAPGMPTKPAKVVKTSPTANALTTTVDLYYEVENHDGHLRPGQRVGITLPLKGEAESLVVPNAAILRDINGGAWVYQDMGKHVYARRRVVVDHIIGPDAVLAMGPKVGTKVVTDGAAEIFGTEFGGGK